MSTQPSSPFLIIYYIMKKYFIKLKTKIKNIYNFLQFVEKKRLELMERATWGKF